MCCYSGASILGAGAMWGPTQSVTYRFDSLIGDTGHHHEKCSEGLVVQICALGKLSEEGQPGENRRGHSLRGARKKRDLSRAWVQT